MSGSRSATFQPSPDGLIIAVRVVPRASRSTVDGLRNQEVQVRLNAPPVDGAANAELIDLLARTLGIPRRDVEIVSGERSRSKRVRLAGIDEPTTRARLGVG